MLKLIVKNLGDDHAYVQPITDGVVGDQRKIEPLVGMQIEGDMVMVDKHLYPVGDEPAHAPVLEPQAVVTVQDDDRPG